MRLDILSPKFYSIIFHCKDKTVFLDLICILSNLFIILSQMNIEQKEYLNIINQSSDDVIFIKNTGKEGISFIEHSHSKHQIIYTLSGTLHIQIDSASYFIPQHHVAWIPANIKHELSSNNRQISLLVFYCNLNLPKEDPRQTLSIYNVNAVTLENLKYIATFNNIISELEQPDLYNYILSFFKILPSINNIYDIPLKGVEIHNNPRLIPILHYINDHLHENLNMTLVANEFGFSVRNLSRLFSKSGILFSNYLNYQRITRSIERFADGNKTMQDIAYEVGFNTPNHFNRIFKMIMGVSPGTFCRKL